MSFAQIAVRFAAVMLALAISALSFLGAQVGAQPAAQSGGTVPLHLSPEIVLPVATAEYDPLVEMAERAALGLPRLTEQ